MRDRNLGQKEKKSHGGCFKHEKSPLVVKKSSWAFYFARREKGEAFLLDTHAILLLPAAATTSTSIKREGGGDKSPLV